MKRGMLLVALLLGCQAAAHDEDELAGAKAQVSRFFAALDKGDCATLGSMVPAASGEHCEKFLHEWHEDLHLQLVDISDVRRDGRDKSAIIVRTNVNRRGEVREMLFRVSHEQGVWQLVL